MENGLKKLSKRKKLKKFIMVANKNTILVVVAHPDDEVLGCGGTIAKEVSLGREVFVLILGDGETSRDEEGDIKKKIKQKQNFAQKASSIMGVKKLFLEKLPDNKFDSLPLLDIVKLVEKYLAIVKPDTIFTHHLGDLNIDHRLTFQAVLTATRPQPGCFIKKIFSFEVLSSTEWQVKKNGLMFCPNYYSNITDFFDKKIEALSIYEKELRAYPHPRSIQGVEVLAKYRGIESGYNFAEAFQLIRQLSD